MKKALVWVGFLPLSFIVASLGYLIIYFSVVFFSPIDDSIEQPAAYALGTLIFTTVFIRMSYLMCPIKGRILKWLLVVPFLIIGIAGIIGTVFIVMKVDVLVMAIAILLGAITCARMSTDELAD